MKTITFHYSNHFELQQAPEKSSRFTKVSHSRFYNNILELQLPEIKNKTNKKPGVQQERKKKNSMPTVKSIDSYKGLASYAPERKLNIPRPTSAILSREEGLAFSSSPVLSEESGVSCPELGGKVE